MLVTTHEASPQLLRARAHLLSLRLQVWGNVSYQTGDSLRVFHRGRLRDNSCNCYVNTCGGMTVTRLGCKIYNRFKADSVCVSVGTRSRDLWLRFECETNDAGGLPCCRPSVCFVLTGLSVSSEEEDTQIKWRDSIVSNFSFFFLVVTLQRKKCDCFVSTDPLITVSCLSTYDNPTVTYINPII